MSSTSSERVATRQPRPISSARMETVTSRSVAFFGLLFGAQTLPVMLSQESQLKPNWFWLFAVAVYGSLLLCLVSSIIRKFVRTTYLLVSLTWLASMATWPLAVVDPSSVATTRPWLWFLCTVATATAAVALPIWPAIGFLILAPLVYGLVRLTPSAGQAGVGLSLLDTVYAVLLGGAVLLILTLLRDAAASVDAAQAMALSRYGEAVRHHATEVERIQVDSIVHDSVLSTLISIARAETPEARMLASKMASQAITQLEGAAASSNDDDTSVSLSQLVDRLESTSASLSGSFLFDATRIGIGSLQISVAESIYSASVQAMVNSLQHAGKATRRIEVRGIGNSGIEVKISDDGRGFDPKAVPAERLGLRVSIIERVKAAGGQVTLKTKPFEGTMVLIRWPAKKADQ